MKTIFSVAVIAFVTVQASEVTRLRKRELSSDGSWITTDKNFQAGVSAYKDQSGATAGYAYKSIREQLGGQNWNYNTCEGNGQASPYACTGNGWPNSIQGKTTCEYLKSESNEVTVGGEKALKTVGHIFDEGVCCSATEGSGHQQPTMCTKGICYQIKATDPNKQNPDYPGGAIILGVDGAAINSGHSVEMGYEEKVAVFTEQPMQRVPVKYRMVDCKTFEPI